MKNLSNVLFLILIGICVFATFFITKDMYDKQPEVKKIIVEGKVDSTYIQVLQDSIKKIKNITIQKDTVFIKGKEKFLTRYDTIYVESKAKNPYKFIKPFTITDKSNNFNFDVEVSGTDSIFTDKFFQTYIRKNISISIKNFKYHIEADPPKKKRFKLFAGGGIGIYQTSQFENIADVKLNLGIILNTKHLFLFSKSFGEHNGFELYYNYRILQF